jgi:hypothetical protein
VYTSIEDQRLLPVVKAMASKREHLVAKAKERLAQAERDVTKQREIIELARSKGEDTEQQQSVLHRLLLSRDVLRKRLRRVESAVTGAPNQKDPAR